MTSLISGFILDIDGTLLDSTPAHLKAWQSILHEVGLNKSDAQILQHFGKRTEQIASDLFQTEVSPELINYIAEQKTLDFSMRSKKSHCLIGCSCFSRNHEFNWG